MGTNYYVKLDRCKHCGRSTEVHLGKSSGGWEFSFQYNGGEYYKNIEEMKEWLEDKQIYNEYDEKISNNDFWQLVESKIGGLKHTEECPDDENSFRIGRYEFSDFEFS